MRADTLRGQVGGGWALEMESFLGPVKWHRADRRVPFGAQKWDAPVHKLYFRLMVSSMLLYSHTQYIIFLILVPQSFYHKFQLYSYHTPKKNTQCHSLSKTNLREQQLFQISTKSLKMFVLSNGPFLPLLLWKGRAGNDNYFLQISYLVNLRKSQS
jgi:hypothetical protein